MRFARVAAGRRAPAWSSLALVLGQLALMATNLGFSLSLAYAGGLAAVGATAPAVLVFQLTVGVLQRALAEATLLAESHADRRADRAACRWSVAAAFLGGLVGAVAAVGATLAVPGAPPGLVLAYAAGIPFAIASDIGRSAGVAAGHARAAAAETAAWLSTQMVMMVVFGAVRSPLGVCLAWAGVNAAFFLATALQPDRRPGLRGLGRWLRSRRGLLGPASLDALLIGLTPVLAMQLTAFVVTAATLGAIRVLQQVFAPLAFVSITMRRVLVYRRRPDAPSTPRGDLRDGLLSLAATVPGALLIAVAVVAGRGLFPALAFIPTGAGLVAAAGEKAMLGLSFGVSLSGFVRGEFRALLRARYLMLGLTLVAAPLLAARWGAAGYLTGSAAAMLVYSLTLLVEPARPVSLEP